MFAYEVSEWRRVRVGGCRSNAREGVVALTLMNNYDHPSQLSTMRLRPILPCHEETFISPLI